MTERSGQRSAIATDDQHDPDDVAWVFHPDRDVWVARGFERWADAGRWIEAGVTPRAAASFAGWADPDETAVWAAGMFLRHEAEEWRDRGFPAEDAVRWSKNVGPREAVVWADLQFDADECRGWKAHGFDAGNAAIWRASGYDPVRASAWSAAATEAWTAQHIGKPTADWAIRWTLEQIR